MKKEIILIGGGGHCKACIDVIEMENKFKIGGIVDKKEKLHQKVLGYEIIAGDEDLLKLARQYKYFLVTIGQIKRGQNRIEKFEYLKKMKAEFPVIISPLAYVSKHALIAEGTIIMHKAFVNADVNIGKNCIINTASLIEHDVKIGDNCHISIGSVIGGKSCLEEGVFIGGNSVIANNIHISKNTAIGAGSVVVKSIEKSGVYAGNPARKLDENA